MITYNNVPPIPIDLIHADFIRAAGLENGRAYGGLAGGSMSAAGQVWEMNGERWGLRPIGRLVMSHPRGWLFPPVKCCCQNF